MDTTKVDVDKLVFLRQEARGDGDYTIVRNKYGIQVAIDNLTLDLMLTIGGYLLVNEGGTKRQC